MKKHKENITNNKCKINSYPAIINIKSGRYYGYINNKGKFTITPKFSDAQSFNNDGLAIISENNYYGVINTKAHYIVYPIYDSIQPFIEKRAVYTLGNAMGVLSENGNLVTSKPYTFINNFSDSLALVSITDLSGNSLYGYIDIDGNEVIVPKFIVGNDFKDGYALVKDVDNLYKVIDKTGKVYTTFNYKYVGNYNEGVFTFSEEIDGLLGYISLDGHVIIEPKFTSASSMEDSYMIVSTSSDFTYNYGVINLSNQSLYPLTFNNINYLGNKRFALGLPRDKDKTLTSNIYAIGNGKGNILTSFNYLNVERYTNGFASAYDSENTFFLDLNGNISKKLPLVNGSGILKMECNLIYAYVDSNPYYISQSGKLIYEPNNIIPLDNKYTLLKLKYKPNVDYLVYYPQIKNSTTQEVINYKLRNLSNLKKVDTDEVLDYNLFGSFKILFFNKELLVLEMNTYNYPFGAAHGLTTRSTPNINLLTGEFYSLEDLFKGSIYWVGELNKIIENMIKTNSTYSSVYEDGFKGINENQSFYVDENNLYIYFEPYEIAPYSSGFVTFKIPFKEIDPMINKNGSFYKSFN